MTYPLTGTDRGRGGLRVSEVDGSPDVYGVNWIVVSNGTLTDDGQGKVTITTGGGGGGSLTVKLSDDSVSVASVTTVAFDVDDGFTDTDYEYAIRVYEGATFSLTNSLVRESGYDGNDNCQNPDAVILPEFIG